MSLLSRNVRTSLSLLGILYASVLLAGLIAPYAPTEQNRDMPFAPPTRLHFAEATGKLHLRPFVYRLVSQPGSFGDYGEDRGDRLQTWPQGTRRTTIVHSKRLVRRCGPDFDRLRPFWRRPTGLRRDDTVYRQDAVAGPHAG